MKSEFLQLGRALFRLPAAARALARTPAAIPATHPLALPSIPRLPIALTLLALLAALLILLPPESAYAAAPTFDDGTSTTRTVPENSAVGTNVGTVVAATDTDTSDSLTYSLTGTDSASFDFDTTDGQIKTKPESTDGRREGWANWYEGAYKRRKPGLHWDRCDTAEGFQ